MAAHYAFKIYILLSIKTRIETRKVRSLSAGQERFISYYPLKQGLKPQIDAETEKLREDLYPTIH